MSIRAYLLALLLSLALPLAGCPGEVDDDDTTAGDDDDSVADDDDSAGDDDDSAGDDDDSVGDDDDSVGDDDDSAGDDDDSAGDDDDSAGDDDDSAGEDADGDGSPASEDCDDTDPANYPGNTEVCDGQDNDCDAATFAADEDTDADSDGAVTCLDCDDADPANFPGNAEVCDEADNDCDATTFAIGEDTDVDNDGSVTCLDCDDADTNNFPGNTEICDGADNDCDATTWAADEDVDADNDGATTCLDCDDADPANFPGNPEVCDAADNDCDATTFATGEDTDADSDNVVTCLDCDDADPDNFPGNPEVCDGADNDCDATTVFTGEDIDADSDQSVACLDCDDADPDNFPGNTEVCDGADNDCDATTDYAGDDWAIGGNQNGAFQVGGNLGGTMFEALEPVTITELQARINGTADVTPIVGTRSGTSGDWTVLAVGQTTTGSGADEFISSGPMDIDLVVGEQYFIGWYTAGPTDFYYRANLNGEPSWSQAVGFAEHDDGNASLPTLGGTFGTEDEGNFAQYNLTLFTADEDDVDSDGETSCGTDCNDDDPAINSVATELCDGIDNDCDATTVFTGEDTDADSDQVLACLDCDDADPDNFPGNTEVCDAADNDCDATTVFTGEDTDADSDQVVACLDCDDLDPDSFPGNTEVCDGQDNDCDGAIDFSSGQVFDFPGTAISAIGSNLTYTETIVITLDGTIEDLDVSLDISHTWVDDLDVTLTSPSGTTADLFSDRGGSSDDLDILLDDESTNTLPNDASGSGVLVGDYQTENDPLSIFDGEAAAGTWTLVVTDDFNGSGGTINEWGLIFNVLTTPGESETCAVESCADVIALNGSAGDGDYWLDPGWLGLAAEYSCDMTTDNGGWTLVYDWDRALGDTATDFANSFDTWVNGMGVYTDETWNIRWEDGNFSYDALYGYRMVDVPNGGDMLYDISFEGESMEGSGTWFTAETVAGDEELYCHDDASGDSNYDAAELAYVPGYTCSLGYVDDPIFSPGSPQQISLGSEVTGVELTSLMSDSNSGDISRLYYYRVWVR